MESAAGNKFERPFKAESKYSKYQVDCLEYWNWFDCAIKSICQEIPEYLGPEESFKRRSDLYCREMLVVAETDGIAINILAPAVIRIRRPQ